MSVLHDVVARIKSDPAIQKVVISAEQRERLLIELDDPSPVKRGPRPNYSPDDWLWDELEAMMKHRAIDVMGVPVVIKDEA